MEKQSTESGKRLRVRDTSIDVSFRAVGGYRLTLKKITRFLESVNYNPEVIRSFILQFYDLPVEEFLKYEKLWYKLQDHLQEKIDVALLLQWKEKTGPRKIDLEKEGIKIFIHELAQCHVKKIFGEQTSHAVIDIFSSVIKTPYKTTTLYRMMRMEINLLEEEEKDKEEEKKQINK